MLRRITLASLLLLAVAACADAPSAPPATRSVPATPAASQTIPPSTPRPTDESPLLSGGPGDAGQSCRAQCERTFNICGDSVAARSQSGEETPDRPSLFSPINDCRDELRRCFSRCGAPVGN